MSTRTFNQPDETLDYYYQFKQCGTSTFVTQNSGSYVLKRQRGLKTGAETPSFYRKLRQGDLLPLNSYRRWDYYMFSPGMEFDTSCNCNPSGAWHTRNVRNHTAPDFLWSGSAPVLPNFWTDRDINIDALVTAAIADISGDFDALTFAAEFPKTYDMVRNAHRRARDLLQQATRGGFHFAKAAASAWLEWRYGWEILGYDIRDIDQLLRDPIRPLVVTGRAGTSETWSTVDTLPNYQWGHHGLSGEREVSYDCSYRANAIARWRGQPLNVLVSLPVTAWELVPFSFVADWFVNVGDVIRAWEVRMNVSDLYVSLGEKYRVESKGTVWPTPGTCTGSQVGSASALKYERVVGRSRFPWHTPSHSLPSFDVNLTTKRLIDLAALLANRLPT